MDIHIDNGTILLFYSLTLFINPKQDHSDTNNRYITVLDVISISLGLVFLIIITLHCIILLWYIHVKLLFALEIFNLTLRPSGVSWLSSSHSAFSTFFSLLTFRTLRRLENNCWYWCFHSILGAERFNPPSL